MAQFFISGTDTDVGKTIASAWLALHLNAAYWKPIQSGLSAPTDTQTFKEITRFDASSIFDETYRLEQPLSPHESARRENVCITLDAFTMPNHKGPLIVEGAGGLMVPLNETDMVIDLIKHLDISTILVARSSLGTINHTLLSIEALQARAIPIKGLIINGPLTPHNHEALRTYGKLPILGEIPHLDSVNKESLLAISPLVDLNDHLGIAV